MKLSSIPFYLSRPSLILPMFFYKLYTIRHPDEPWLAQGAIAYCAENLRSDMHGLEWGSGRSTAWFARHLGHLTSVEHDEGWYRSVQGKLRELSNVDYRFIAADDQRKENSAYAAVADDFADDSLDFVVVDGVHREQCVAACLNKLKPGGLLLIDNTNWLTLEEWGVPSGWPVVHQSQNAQTQTTLWRKPCHPPAGS